MISRKFHLSRISLLTAFSAWVFCNSAAAQPQVLNHQGRIAVQGVNFEGNGQFKFALVNANGSVTYWSNNGSSVAGAEPTAAVTLAVSRGLYAVLLGNLALPNMTGIPPAALEYEDVRLRVWFNDGVRGFQQISPDQPLAAVPYAIHARKALAADSFGGLLAGDVTGGQSATAIADVTVTGKRLTGFAAATGTLTSADSILSAIGKLHGNSALQAPLASPTFTGTVAGITASMVGLGNVTNSSDANKPVSTAQQTALDLKANLASPTFSGTVAGITASMVGLGNVTNSSDANKPVSTAQQTALDLKANLASPTFSGTVAGITASMVGLGNVTNTSDANKPVSTAQQTALDLKANLASPQFTGTVRLPAGSSSAAAMRFALGTNLNTAVFGAVEFDGTNLYLTNNSATPTRKTIAYTDSVIASGAVGSSQLASGLTLGGTTTGSFSGPLSGNATTATSATGFTGALAGDVSGTQGATSIAAATVTGKALAGFVSGAGTVTAADTVLSAINKLDGNVGLKANLASPTFTGTVTLPTGSTAAAPLRLAAGTNLSAAVFGAVEFDGSKLYLTTDALSPVRKTLAFTEDLRSEVSLASITAAPVKPVIGWGDNGSGQTSIPTLANVAAVAAGEAHSLALLDGGTVVAWGLNGSGQTSVPAGLAGVTQISAGANFNLARKNDGTVTAWGENDFGQTTLPGGISTATQVAAGMNHGLSLLANGSVVAWGDNTFGQTTLPTLSNVTAIAAGYDHSLALKSDGTVVAWGRDDAGQVTLPAGLSGVTAIAAGAYHSLALKSDGTLVAWGWDRGGQVTLPVGLAGVVEIAGGYAFSMALKADGSVVVWGDNSSSQTTVPSSASLVTHLAAGANHALALRADAIPAQVARLDQDNVFSGKVGIGRNPAVNALEVAGNASKSTSGGWSLNSDRRIKSEIRPILGALEKLDQVRLVDFRYTENYLATHPVIVDRRYPNVIAQEFAEVFPDDVKSSGERLPDGSEILQVDTYPLTIYTAAAVQELHRENQALKQQISAQELRLRKLEAALEK
jgi:hypothetical protein